MAKNPHKSGPTPGRPANGTNGPNDKGGGTKTYAPPMPPSKKNGVQTGTKK